MVRDGRVRVINTQAVEFAKARRAHPFSSKRLKDVKLSKLELKRAHKLAERLKGDVGVEEPFAVATNILKAQKLEAGAGIVEGLMGDWDIGDRVSNGFGGKVIDILEHSGTLVVLRDDGTIVVSHESQVHKPRASSRKTAKGHGRPGWYQDRIRHAQAAHLGWRRRREKGRG